ncbi:MAG: hypothetical protein M3068_13565 [Gemmatimonadota bacterium]|nr:hypothetical protein [Gemmatimonadota bacterium]
MRTALTLLLAAGMTAAFLAAGGRSAPERELAPARADSAGDTEVGMRNVHFYVAPDVVLRIRRLRGQMVSKKPGPLLFDDPTSFTIRIVSAEVGLTTTDLSALLNHHVFAYPGAPLKHLVIHASGAQLVQKGLLHKGVDIPFEITSTPDVTAAGLIRLHPSRIKIFGVDGSALMKALHLSLEKMLDLSKAHGVSVHGDDLFLAPDSILPPPSISGRVTAIRVEGDELVQTFGTSADSARVGTLALPDTTAANYMFFRGGTLRFGRLLMLDAEMEIVDLDPTDPFQFDISRYNKQLIAGYSRTLPDLGLEVFMRDIEKVGRSEGADFATPLRSPLPRASKPPSR